MFTSTAINGTLIVVLGLLASTREPAASQPLEIASTIAPPLSAAPETIAPTTSERIAAASEISQASDFVEIPLAVHGGLESRSDTTVRIDVDLERWGRLPLVIDDAGEPPLPETASVLLGLRSDAARSRALVKYGGTKESELAVAWALHWLANHQAADGGWSFDHRTSSCGGRCDHPGGMYRARIAATAMALLPFLGAGHTHRHGPYRRQIGAGLNFLAASMIVGPNGGDLQATGTMYSQALATIALCEAYSLTQDRKLMQAAQAAVQFIEAAQDREGGGWRYSPGQPGDTSSLGWQLMALKSASLGYLKVRPETIAGAGRFLDSVALDDGAAYSYMPEGDRAPRASATAIGLLCRLYLGSRPGEPAIARGVAEIRASGPSQTDLYYDYYAAQVLLHVGGREWHAWNDPMRNHLVATQAKEGHAAGSWYFEGGFDNHNRAGGRLYCTALATLILEVYYRHLPLYRADRQHGF